MNAKILIVALCAFQLAAGGLIDSIIAAPLSIMNGLFSTAQSQAASVQQQFQDLFQSVNQNLTSQIDFGLSQFQQNINSLNGSSQTDACTSNLTQQYYAIGNASLALFKTGFSILNETIRNGSWILTNVSSRIQTAIPQAISNFTQCFSSSKGFFFSSIFTIPTCGITTVTNQFAAFANTTNAQTQTALQIFNQLLSPPNLNSTVNSLPQMAALAAQTLASVGAQIAAVNAQVMQCILQTANSTFAGTGFSG